MTASALRYKVPADTGIKVTSDKCARLHSHWLFFFSFLSFSLLFKAHHLSDGWKAGEKNFKLS